MDDARALGVGVGQNRPSHSGSVLFIPWPEGGTGSPAPVSVTSLDTKHFLLAPKDRARGVLFAHSLPSVFLPQCVPLLFVIASWSLAPFSSPRSSGSLASPAVWTLCAVGPALFLCLSQSLLLMRLGREAPPKASSALSQVLTTSCYLWPQ